MALTTAQKISLCEILEIPYSTQFYTTDGMGALASLTNINNSTSGQAKTALTTWLDALDSDTETKLLTYISRWDTIGTTAVAMQQGAVGQLNGVTLDYTQERGIIRQRVQKMVPFFVWTEVQKRMNGDFSGNGVASSGVGSVAMIR